jgi:hypothetical protein
MGAGLAISPASSQDADFTIDPTVGLPGDEVATQLDPEALAESECYLTPAQVQDPEVGVPGPLSELAAAIGAAAAEAELDADQAVAATTLQLIIGALGSDLTRSAQVEQLLANFFVLTFVDIGTMEPVGERSTFDPETGEGEIVVPDLDPGLWAVAATCVFPTVDDPAAFLAAVDATVAVLRSYPAFLNGEDALDLTAIVVALLFNPELAAEVGEAVLTAALPLLVAPRDQWTAPFTIPAALPTADPAVAAFCAALPQLPAVGEELMTLLAALPEDDGMTQAEWEDAADWEAIGAELEDLVAEIVDLLDEGDTYRPDALADEWAEATAPLRQVRDALEAVDYDLSSVSGRQIAGQLREGATSESEDAAGDSATAALTEWFVANCIAEDGPTPPPAAPAARATGAQPRYTG